MPSMTLNLGIDEFWLKRLVNVAESSVDDGLVTPEEAIELVERAIHDDLRQHIWLEESNAS